MAEAKEIMLSPGDSVKVVGVANGIQRGLPIFGRDDAIQCIAVSESVVVDSGNS